MSKNLAFTEIDPKKNTHVQIDASIEHPDGKGGDCCYSLMEWMTDDGVIEIDEFVDRLRTVLKDDWGLMSAGEMVPGAFIVITIRKPGVK